MSEGAVRLPGIERGKPVRLTLNGRAIPAFEGETVATALLADGQWTLRHTNRHETPRGVFCGMGVCFDCMMIIDDRPGTRACVTSVRDGMRVETGKPTGG